jgi:hypothetical protein
MTLLKYLNYFFLFLIFSYNLHSQKLVATLTQSPTTQDFSRFGAYIDITKDDNYIVSSSYLYDTTKTDAGLVQVFKKNGDNWDLLLSDSGLDVVDDEIGTNVAITRFNDLIFIAAGAPAVSRGLATNGYVKLYVYDINASAFTSTGLDLNSDGDLEDVDEGAYFLGDGPSDYFGSSISFSGDGTTMAVGGTGYEPLGGSNTGHVRVYKYQNDVNKTWREVTTVDEIIGINNASLGRDVALNGDGNRLLVTSSSKGYFEVYDYDGADWTVVGTTSTTFDEADDIFMGFEVDISSDGNRLILGALGYDEPGLNNIGFVKIYNYDNTQPSKWSLSATVTGTAGTDLFGQHLDLSEDGIQFITSGQGLNNRDLFTSTDGVNWTAKNFDFGNSTNIQPVKISKNLALVSDWKKIKFCR